LVVGAGFLGGAVAREALAGGWLVVPVVRSEKSAELLRGEFSGVVQADAVDSTFWHGLVGRWQGLVWSLSPSRGEESAFNEMHRHGAQRAAVWAAERGVPLIYISSTSVYAEADGGWVDEDSPIARHDERSMAMVEAERSALGVGGSVLRCGGIYGPGREQRQSQEGPERWVNVVQVKDAARAVGLVLGKKRQIYNVCEDEPLRRGFPAGRWPEGRKERRNKRVSNAKLRRLGWQPLWRAGCRTAS